MRGFTYTNGTGHNMSTYSMQGKEMNKHLVKGYISSRYDDKLKHYETAYAVTDEGDVYTTGEREFNNAFDPAGTRWTRTDALPDGVEFIGNYGKPNF